MRPLLVFALLVCLAPAPHHVHAGAHSPSMKAMTALHRLDSPLSPSATHALLAVFREGELQFCTANASLARIYCADNAFRGIDVCILLFFNYGYRGQTCSGVSNSSQNELLASTFFFPNSLGPGKVLHLPAAAATPQNVELYDEKARFLPQALAASLHFDPPHIKKLMRMYGVLPGSYMEAAMSSTLKHCSLQPSPQETKACHASLESMEAFITDTLGPNATALRPPSLPTSVKDAQVIKKKLFNKLNQKVVSCHAMGFPSLLYSCHMAPKSQLMIVSLQTTNGSTTTYGVAICHHDTNYWSTQHPVFKALHTRPGKGTICHWLPHSSFIFIQKLPLSTLAI